MTTVRHGVVRDGYKTLGNVAVVPQSLFPSLIISRLVLEAVVQESIHPPGGSSYGFRQGWQRLAVLANEKNGLIVMVYR